MNNKIEIHERELENFKNNQERKFMIGKRLVYIIASINIVLSLVFCFVHFFSYLYLVILILVSILLYRGISWSRYLYAGCGLISAMIILYLFAISSGYGLPIIIIGMALIAYEIASSVMLLVNKNVRQFFY